MKHLKLSNPYTNRVIQYELHHLSCSKIYLRIPPNRNQVENKIKEKNTFWKCLLLFTSEGVITLSTFQYAGFLHSGKNILSV
jgi:hypothetical protein